jgi:hypothetical protein
MNKRRRISEDGKISPINEPTTTPSQKLKVMPNFMTPTKASLAKSYPHLAKSQPPRGPSQRIPSPTRQPPRPSVPPQPLTEIIQVNNNGSRVMRRSFMDIANDRETEPTGMAMGAKKPEMTHLSSEEEIERQKGVLMRRLRLLRAECENLEQQLDQARQSKQNSLDAQRKASSNVDATM